MLKTYITTVDSLGKFKVSDYLKYLISNTHKNHVGRTEIFDNNQDHRNFFRLNSEKIRGNIRYKQEMKRNKKQGWHNRLVESNKSLVFNVPVSYEATDEELKEIHSQLTEMIIEDYRENGVELDYYELYSNIHKQKNNHINFIIPSIDKEYKTIRHIRKMGYRDRLAQKFTKIVDEVLGKEFSNYNKDTETLTIMTNEEKRFSNGDFTLEELIELSNKPYENKMLKNLYKMFVRIKKQEEDMEKHAKNVLGVEKTLNKLINGEQATNEEKQLAKDVFASLNAGALLTEKQQRELKKGTKEYNNFKK